MKRHWILIVSVASVVAAGAVLSNFATAQGDKGVDAKALERTRKQVQMLDDVYKTAVVLITDTYVQDKKSYPAGRTAVKWFHAISKKGWHEVRIIDVTGEPYNPENVAKDAFEKEGVKQLKAGKAYYDQVETKGDKSYLRAITTVPVVMQKCVLCHDHYKNAKSGEAIGALTYTVPIE